MIKQNMKVLIHTKIINETDIDDDVFKTIDTTVISNIQKFLGKGLD